MIFKKKDKSITRRQFKYYSTLGQTWESYLYVLEKNGWVKKASNIKVGKNLFKSGTKTFVTNIVEYKKESVFAIDFDVKNVGSQKMVFRIADAGRTNIVEISSQVVLSDKFEEDDKGHNRKTVYSRIMNDFLKTVKGFDDEVRDYLEFKGYVSYY